MRRVGLLGGMSWESSALYYQLLNQGVAERLGELHSADLVLASVDFAAISALQSKGRWEAAGELLADRARGLELAGAEMVLICTNTMHKVAEHVQTAIEVPLLNIIDVTAEAAARLGATQVGLVGTKFTMEQPFYRERMASHGLALVVPNEPGRDLVHRVIYKELCRGVFTDLSRTQVSEVIQGLVDLGAEAVILGCTEIELLVGQNDCTVPVLPTTALHAEAAVQASLR